MNIRVFRKSTLFILSIHFALLIDLYVGSVLIEVPASSPLVGVTYKALLLFIVLTYSVKLDKVVLISVNVLVIITLFNTVFENLVDLPSNLIAGSKFIMFSLIFYLFDYYRRAEYINVRSLSRIGFSSLFIILTNQIIGLLGFGKATYTHMNIGTTGFFFESNAYGLVVILVEAILLVSAIEKLKSLIVVIFILFFNILTLTIATKMAMIGSVIVPLVVLYFKRRKLFNYSILFIIFIALTQIERIETLSEITKISKEIENLGLVNGLTSGRSERASLALNNYVENYSYFEKIVGLGNSRVIKESVLGGFTEIDFIDILLSTGIIGLILVYVPFFLICYKHLVLARKSGLIEFRIVLTINVFFLLLSSLGGHLFTSGTVAIFLALLNIYPFFLNHRVKSFSEIGDYNNK